MHVRAIIGVFTLLLKAALAQSSQDALKGLPECAVNCTLPVVRDLPCNITTLPQLALCLCPNITAQHALAACVQKSCTFDEQKISTGGNQLLCGKIPIESRQAYINVILIIVTALTLPFIMLRGWSRWIIAKRFAADDWAILTAAVLILTSMGLELKMTKGGFGRHIWTVDLNNLSEILGIFYAVSILYAMIQGFTKISVCLFYLRLFPVRWFQTATICTIVLITCSCTGFIFAIAFQCEPAVSFWDRSIPSKCIDQNAMSYAGAAASISQHIIILLLPIPCISSLQIGRGKKISLFVLFGLGIFALLTSLIRIKYIVGFGSTTDITWDYANIEIWSVIELAVAFICACLPAFRPLLSRYAPNLFSASRTRDGPNSQPPNGSKATGGISVSNTYDVTRSKTTTANDHVDIERGSRVDSDELKGPHSMMSFGSQGRSAPSGRAWSVGSEETELVDITRLENGHR